MGFCGGSITSHRFPAFLMVAQVVKKFLEALFPNHLVDAPVPALLPVRTPSTNGNKAGLVQP